MKSIFKAFVLSVLMVAQVNYAAVYAADTASILPPAKTQFLDANGKPLTSGTVDFYIPGGTTRKTTWQDAAETIPNLNPVVLDAAGRALILGFGSYRQVVKDRNSNIIWDQVTSSAGSGGGGATVGDGNAVGTIKPWAGFIAPVNYVFTYGQELNRTTYSALLGTITLTQAVTCTSGSATLSTIADTTQLNIGAAVEAACMPAGSVINSKTATSVTLNNNALVSTTLNATFFPYGNGNGTTTFNVPDYRGVVLPGRCNMGGSNCSVISNPTYTDPNAIYGIGGSQLSSNTITMANLPASPAPVTASTGPYSPVATSGGNPAVSPAGSDTGVGGAGGGTFNTYDSTKFRSIQINGFSSLTVSSNTANLGSGTALSINNIQPSKTINYAIKVLPDSSASIIVVPSGATSVPLFSTGVPGADPVYRAITGADLPNPTLISLGGVFANTPPAGGVLSNIDATGTPQYATSMILTGASVFMLGVGRLGATNPAFQVDASQALQDTGIKITGQAGINGVNFDAIGANASVPLIINAKGIGTINFGTNSTGNNVFFRGSNHQGSSSGSHTVVSPAAASGVSTWPTTTGTIVNTGSYGTGIAAALAINTGLAGAPVINGGGAGTLTSLAAQAAFTFVGNNTSGSATPTAVDIAALTTKASPAVSDYIMISDQAASGAWKKATVLSVSSASGPVSSIAGNTGAFTLGYGLTNSVNDLRASLTSVTNSMGADLAVANGSYTDGPSTAQGTSGTWLATSNILISESSGGAVSCKIWDGTNTAVTSTRQSVTAGQTLDVAMSGIVASPAGNIRVSCNSNVATSSFKFNSSGNSKDSTLTVVRITP